MNITVINNTNSPFEIVAADSSKVTFPAMGGEASGDFIGAELEWLRFLFAAGAVTIAPGLAPVNLTEPEIVGAATENVELSVTPGTYSGTPAPVLTYQWLADGEPIVGATDDTYTLTAAEIGAMISVAETATNTGGDVTAVSDEIGPVVAA